MDDRTKEKITKIPLLTTRAGPRDGDQWVARLKVFLYCFLFCFFVFYSFSFLGRIQGFDPIYQNE